MRRLAQAQGSFNVVNGLWPLVGMRTFEAVFGPKADRWLVHTVGGLLTTVGVVQLASREPDQLRVARLLGMGTAATLLTVDVVYVSKRRISRMYLSDAACQACWLTAWALALRRRT
jgi:hypothetical protein